jgi:hypothetical protein
MTAFGRVFACVVLAGAIVLSASGIVHAAGALAIGPCGAYGVAYDHVREDRARAEAVSKCARTACKVVVSIRRNCAAFAVDLRNACGPYGFASAARLGPAQNRALRECYRNGGKDCVIRAFVCDARG